MNSNIALLLVALFGGCFQSLNGQTFEEHNFINQCWSSGNGAAPRWWPDGEIIERGQYVYRCNSGQLRPYGCKTDSGRQQMLEETEIVDDVQFTCTIDSQGNAVRRVSGCAMNGMPYSEGQSWEDVQTNQWYTCSRSSNGYYMQTELKGCYHNGERLAFGERRVSNKCWLECRHDYSGVASMGVCGCALQGGQTHLIGDSYDSRDGRFTEYCTADEASGCDSITVGCIHNRQRLTDGDRYFLGDVIYQCQVRKDSHTHKATGCVQKDEYGNIFERIINCKWYNEGRDKHQYEVECKEDEEGETCYVKPYACIYMKAGVPTLYLLPDTYTIYWTDQKANLGVMCRSVSDTELLVEEFPPEQAVVRAHGLTYDTPRGK